MLGETCPHFGIGADMSDQGAHIAADGARSARESFRPERGNRDLDAHRNYAKAEVRVDGYIALIESRTFVRECMYRGMQAAFSLPVDIPWDFTGGEAAPILF